MEAGREGETREEALKKLVEKVRLGRRHSRSW